MSFRLKRSLYEALPQSLRSPFGWVPFGLAAGRQYRRTLKRGPRFETAGRRESLVYQERALGEILSFATDQVPAYRDLRATVSRLRPFEALQAFPFVDKQTLQEDMQHYLPRNLAAIAHEECSTGGTSGNQLTFYQEANAHAVELAFIHRMWSRVGYRPSSRKVTFRGVAFRELGDGVYWQDNPIYRERQFSPFHMSDRTLGGYLEAMREFRPEYVHGYPSAVSLVADYALRHSVPASDMGIRAVLLGSEALYPDQRDRIERAFGCRVFTWYGHTEKLILGGECETSAVYHHFPDYGILEIVDADGEVVQEDGRRGELVGTGFWNRALPLIRYRTEDVARWRHPRCDCGRRFDRFDNVEGRWKQEYLIGSNGAKISPTALNMHGPMFENVVRYQYYQEQPGRMELRLMVNERFSSVDARALRRAFAEKVGGELTVVQKVVDEIPLTGQGKLRRLIQVIPGNRPVESQ